MSRVTKRIFVSIAAVLVVVLVVGVAAVVIAARRPLPNQSGTLVAAVAHDVRIERDSNGIPHIYGSTDADLMFAQGYVHAQDRFFEMDYRRHVTAGRLSELVGANPAALEADVAVRTLGWRFVAEQEWPLLSREAQDLLTAYSAGVNAYLGSREASELALEYTVLGLQVEIAHPEPWTPVDSLAWLKAMAWDLRSNYDDELSRTAAYRSVGDQAAVAQLYPAYPYDAHSPIIPGEGSPTDVVDPNGPVTSASYQAALDSDAAATALEALSAIPVLVGEGDGIGSNSFAIAGEYTESGKPLLANDPHLELGAPSIWYQIGLHCTAQTPDCTFDVGGFSFSGMPGVIIGHNSKLAWGLTNMGADVADFYFERVFSDGTYMRDGERVPLEERTETILVNGGEPVNLTVRSTGHGPIVTDMVPEAISATPLPASSPPGGLDGYEVSLSWTALQPGRTIEAIFAMNRAETAADVQAAAAIFEVPAQSILFATTRGDIGYQAPGRIPVRAAVVGSVPSDGTWPQPGWDSAYDWQGFVDPAEMPRALNPDEGFIVAANQAVTTPAAGPNMGEGFDVGYRSNRIRELLNGAIRSGSEFTVADANEIMMDSQNPIAEVLVPMILHLDIDDSFVAAAVAELSQWRDAGYPNEAESAGAAYFNTVWAYLVTNTFADELGRETAFGESRWYLVMESLLPEAQSLWWDDVTTVAVTETRDEVLLQSLTDARAHLTRSLAKNPEDWRWGALHQAAFEHSIMAPGAVPGPIAWFFNPSAKPVSGGTSSVNATSWEIKFAADQRPDFTMTAGPSMRMVVNMADFDASTWVVNMGVSGHPASGEYKNQLDAWLAGDSYRWAWSSDAVAAESTRTFTLQAQATAQP